MAVSSRPFLGRSWVQGVSELRVEGLRAPCVGFASNMFFVFRCEDADRVGAKPMPASFVNHLLQLSDGFHIPCRCC